MDLTKENYYDTKMLSVSSVKQFAQNPARALADYKGEYPWFKENVALPLGSAMHDMLECAMDYVKDKKNLNASFRENADNWQTILSKKAEESAIDLVLDEMFHSDFYASVRRKNGNLIAAAEQIPELFSIIWNSEDIQLAVLKAMVSANNDRYDVVAEEPLVGLYIEDNKSIKFKGKPDLFVVDHQTQTIDAYDYKTSKSFDSSGYEWGTDIYGKRAYMPVEWEVQKLFPWQAGVYRELLRQNGYQNYHINYKYLVVTKEKTPRFNIFKISDESMDEGYEQFCSWLVRAYGYINGDLEAPLVQDGSEFANLKSHKKPIEFESHPYYSDAD